MPSPFDLPFTPEKTLENLNTLETQYGFDDALFRNIHHWGKDSGSKGSLAKHREYLTGRSKYKNRSSSNYVVAQRIQYIAEHAVSRESLGKIILDARDQYPFTE